MPFPTRKYKCSRNILLRKYTDPKLPFTRSSPHSHPHPHPWVHPLVNKSSGQSYGRDGTGSPCGSLSGFKSTVCPTLESHRAFSVTRKTTIRMRRSLRSCACSAPGESETHMTQKKQVRHLLLGQCLPLPTHDVLRRKCRNTLHERRLEPQAA